MGEFGVAVLLLLGNAIFVGGEFSLIAARRTVIEPLAARRRMARMALTAMGDIPLMIAGSQLGITVCSLGLGALAEPALAAVLRAPLHLAGLPESVVTPAAILLALAVVVFAHTVIGEMVPKNLALAGPDVAVVWFAPPLLWFCFATKPLLRAVKFAAKAVLRAWRIEAVDTIKTVYTVDELANLAAQSRTQGLLDPQEHARISGALALQRTTARDAMRAWDDVTTVGDGVSPATLEAMATRTGRSRFPVVNRATKKVVGFVHVKDVIGAEGEERRATLNPRFIRPLGVVSPDRVLADLLIAMRRDRRHIVLVSDGRAPLGVLTLHDVLAVVQTLPT
jgi:CBS domain containing-hemolysin-like protein